MVMPRFLRNAVIASDSLNAIAAEVDNLGRACTVRRSAPGPGPLSTSTSVPTATDVAVYWQTEDLDTQGGGMFDPAAANYVLVVVPGLYDLAAQVRCAPVNASGRRSACILVNSTNPASTDAYNGPQALDEQGAAGTDTGVTLSLRTVVPLVAGDRVYLTVRQTSGSTIALGHQDYGGTWLSVTRKAALS